MYNGKTVAVLIPAMNEEFGLAQILPKMPLWLDQVLVIDNGSTDATGEIVRKAGYELGLEPIKGYGAAYQQGIKHIRTELVVCMDGDGQHDPVLIERLLNYHYSNDAHCIFTNRLLNWRQGLFRSFGNWFITVFGNFLFRTDINDIYSGMWLMKTEVFKKILPIERGMLFSVALKMNASQKGYSIGQFPIEIRKSMSSSKLSPFKDGVKAIIYLIKLWVKKSF